jgi:putative ABC transport system substrate-binding protein
MKLLCIHFFVMVSIMLADSSSAWDVLVVQNYRTKPYSEVIRGFKAASSARTTELVLSEMNGAEALREIRKRRPDLILAIGMDSLVTVKKISDTPIVYCMVLNPETVLGNEKNITGISMNIPPEKYLSTLAKALPRLKKIGLVYNPLKTGAIVAKTLAAADKMGIRLTALKAERARDLPRMLESLPDGLDAYWMLPDSTFTAPEAVEALIFYSMRSRVPIFTFSEKYLRMGAFLSLDLDAYELGKQAGGMSDKIKSGVDVAAVPRTDAEIAVPTVNPTIAAKLGIVLNSSSLKKFRFLNKE